MLILHAERQEADMDMDRVDWDMDFEDDPDESEFDDELEGLTELEAERHAAGRFAN